MAAPMHTRDPERAFAWLATLRQARKDATEVTEWLIEKSIGLRRSARPRGTVTKVASAQLPEEPLVQLVSDLKGGGPGDVLHAVAEWGGKLSADAISDELDKLDGWSPALRPHAIHALEILGGERAVWSLAKAVARYAQGPHGEAVAALDALEAIASADAPEVDEGGMMPESAQAMALWDASRANMKGDDGLTGAIALLSGLESAGEIGRRVRVVRGSLVTAAKARLAERARRSAAPARRHGAVKGLGAGRVDNVKEANDVWTSAFAKQALSLPGDSLRVAMGMGKAKSHGKSTRAGLTSGTRREKLPAK